jgi:hypothetical protein
MKLVAGTAERPAVLRKARGLRESERERLDHVLSVESAIGIPSAGLGITMLPPLGLIERTRLADGMPIGSSWRAQDIRNELDVYRQARENVRIKAYYCIYENHVRPAG